MRASRPLFMVAGILAVSVTAVAAQEKRWEIGPRFLVVTAGGEPANDMMSIGLYGEYRLKRPGWFVGGALDRYSYDFERPAKAIGIQQDPGVETIDADAEAVVVSGWIGREHGPAGRRLAWVWHAGLGFSSPDADDVTGPVNGGGTFDITTDPGSEVIVSAAGGIRLRLGERVTMQFLLRADHHFAEWEVEDRNSAAAGTLDDYTGLGGSLGFGIRF